MTNNCLVTKLKGVVNNDNLEKLGEAIFYVATKPSGTSTLNISQKNQNTTVYNASTGELVATLIEDQSSFVLSAGTTYEVHLQNKYFFTSIAISGYSNWDYITVDWDQFMYTEPDTILGTPGFGISDKSYMSKGKLSSLSSFYNKFYPNGWSFEIKQADIINGTLSDITEPSLLTAFSLNGNQTITGNITDFSECINLTRLGIRNANVNVSHTKDFLDALYTNGKRGNLELRFLEKEVAETDIQGIVAGLNTFVFTNDGWTKQ